MIYFLSMSAVKGWINLQPKNVWDYKLFFHVTFEVFTAVTLKNVIFWEAFLHSMLQLLLAANIVPSLLILATLNMVLHSYNLSCIVKFPTRFGLDSYTTIDNIFIDISSLGNYELHPHKWSLWPWSTVLSNI
jgi:hypothetical protein